MWEDRRRAAGGRGVPVQRGRCVGGESRWATCVLRVGRAPGVRMTREAFDPSCGDQYHQRSVPRWLPCRRTARRARVPRPTPSSSVAQWQSIRLLTGGLLVRVQPEEPTPSLRSIVRSPAWLWCKCASPCGLAHQDESSPRSQLQSITSGDAPDSRGASVGDFVGGSPKTPHTTLNARARASACAGVVGVAAGGRARSGSRASRGRRAGSCRTMRSPP